MTLISAMLMIVVSLATKNFAKPSEATLERYFSRCATEVAPYRSVR